MAALLGGISASGLVRALSARDEAAPSSSRSLSPAQHALIAVLAEQVIPRTETPGALDAGVPAFIEQIITGWYTDTEYRIFLQGLDSLEQQAVQQFGQPYVALPAAQQDALLAAQESQAFAERRAHPPAEGSPADKPQIDEQAPFFIKLKELVVVGYYTSETAAQTEMVYLPIPNGYRGEASLAESDGKQYIW